MPRRGRRRRKHRTHTEEETDEPHSLVVRRGKVGPVLKRLVAELRVMIYPNTSLHVKESSESTLKDIMASSAQLNASHLLMVSVTSTSPYLKLVKTPHGPTITYRILKFSLAQDVGKSQARKALLQPDFKAPPLLVTVGITHEWTELILKSLFPGLEVGKMKLSRCHRVVLACEQDGVLHVRHYLVRRRLAHISRSLKKLTRKELPNLNEYNDVGEWMLQNMAGSDSEAEYAEAPENQAQVSIRVVEIGPRLDLQLYKVQEGVCTGAVTYHSYMKKSRKEVRLQGKSLREKEDLRVERRKRQRENIEGKIAKLGETRKKRKLMRLLGTQYNKQSSEQH